MKNRAVQEDEFFGRPISCLKTGLRIASLAPDSPIMPDTSTHSSTPDQELAVLVSKVAALSKLALDMTRHCLDQR
jgi:hypothetical protein